MPAFGLARNRGSCTGLGRGTHGAQATYHPTPVSKGPPKAQPQD